MTDWLNFTVRLEKYKQRELTDGSALKERLIQLNEYQHVKYFFKNDSFPQIFSSTKQSWETVLRHSA